jgi:hypothetical protein
MVENAILRTVIYADIFHYPLTLQELHTFLIHHEEVSCAEVERSLHTSARLRALLCEQDGLIALSTRQDIIALRQSRQRMAQDLRQKAERYGRWLAHIPFVRMVALTGALAMNNPAHERDDLDYLLVVASGRVWLARAFAVLMVRVVRLLGTELCPNYVLATDKLLQTRQDLYVAHEVAQMLPLFGDDVYRAMLASNAAWMSAFLPNAVAHATPPEPAPSRIKRLFERALAGKLGHALEAWEYRRKAQKFLPKAQTAPIGAKIDAHTVKGHFNDHGQRVLDVYTQRLAELGIPQG